jgi:hypothetical protein
MTTFDTTKASSFLFLIIIVIIIIIIIITLIPSITIALTLSILPFLYHDNVLLELCHSAKEEKACLVGSKLPYVVFHYKLEHCGNIWQHPGPRTAFAD